ncbi:N-formylglutamate amidohydrolase [Oligoflexus tunisiensis]|uniref:N-formylglutamate amidohydrolase n=1 Tax=Oligoflexus tunisiensis TaxID=708132 RepID=UPI000ADDECEC|nr:N-formylglutamate amidohydrolase [Oligoflexus tunisiensis]
MFSSFILGLTGLFYVVWIASSSFAEQRIGSENGRRNLQSERCIGPAPADWKYEANESYFGEKNYIEYIPGQLPIIISAPHGGTLAPDEIPPQEGALRDGGSQDNARQVVEELFRLTGERPHLIVNHLTRNRLNANRTKTNELSYGNPAADRAWDEYHAFIEDAKAWVTSSCGRGHYFDFHTNGHADKWVELGIALDRSDLQLADDAFNTKALVSKSTLRHLAQNSALSLAEIVRGPRSLGGLLAAEGIKVVPSPAFPDPGKGGYFNGGYNVRRHGSTLGGVIDGTQIESHGVYINNGAEARRDYSIKLARSIKHFLEIHYGFRLTVERSGKGEGMIEGQDQ